LLTPQLQISTLNYCSYTVCWPCGRAPWSKSVIPRLHDQAIIKQKSSKRQANIKHP